VLLVVELHPQGFTTFVQQGFTGKK